MFTVHRAGWFSDARAVRGRIAVYAWTDVAAKDISKSLFVLKPEAS
jgi:hypothetical protein